MNIHRVLFFCFFSALCGGNTGLVSAKVNIYTGAEGETGTINCNVSPSGSRKFFCKNECKAEDILVKTDDVRAQSGRYSIEYRDGSSGRGIVSVTITNLTKSDSGRYRCGLGGTSVPESFSDFEVRVSDATGISGFLHTYTEGENVTLGCSDTVYGRQKFFCKGECKKEEDIIIDTDGNRAQSGRYSIKYDAGSVFGLYVSITQVTKSDSGQYRCGYGRALSPDSYRKLQIMVIDVPTTLKPTSTLPVFLTSDPSVSTPTQISQTDQQQTGTASPRGLQTRGNSDGTNMEVTFFNSLITLTVG
ncbi:polymeric immunoglobulin receptor-like isoform X2 [Micropterus salmoides]|uniref:polymeric immunoglobulin receptor-like isoform X2 n=1 Tax=Micropterus salmoides TaxID=27706 RepID=UPI0018EC3E18|nr:polymeric immunoglobulin receptor-like isoform X2 [Micropterus salmoides]